MHESDRHLIAVFEGDSIWLNCTKLPGVMFGSFVSLCVRCRNAAVLLPNQCSLVAKVGSRHL